MYDIKLDKFIDKEGYIDLLKVTKRNFLNASLKEARRLLIENGEYSICIGIGPLVNSLCNFEIFDDITSIFIYLTAYGIEFSFFLFIIMKSIFFRDEQDIENIIKNSEMYVECNELYKKYLLDLSDFIKNINLKDSLEISYFFTKMLGDGYLSLNNHHEYKDFKNDYDKYSRDLLGTRVMTGESVCRHDACMLTDLLNIMGYEACNLRVKGIESYSCLLPFLIKTNNVSFNHLITGIIDNGEKYVFDPTGGVGLVSVLDTEFEKKYKLKSNSITYSKAKQQPYTRYVIENTPLIKRYKKFLEEFEKFKQALPKDNSFVDREYIHLETKEKINYYKKDLTDFYREHLEMVSRITELNNYIAPHSNKLIKEWKIK